MSKRAAATYDAQADLQEALDHRSTDDLPFLRECLSTAPEGWRQKMIAARIKELENGQAAAERLAGPGRKRKGRARIPAEPPPMTGAETSADVPDPPRRNRRR